MDHIKTGFERIDNRFGLHYFPDTLHYGEKDLKLWLPRLQQLNAGWLVLKSATTRAIPEEFISALVQAGIQPIVDFDVPLSQDVYWPDMEVLLRAYGRWGVSHALLNRQPNNQSAWSTADWRRPDLVSSFTRQFQDFAQLALDCGIKPVYAPLAQGGDYWDLSFLEASLKQLEAEAPSYLINNLTLSAYAWDQGRSIDWGAGGSKVWKDVKAYNVPAASQDQRGFRAFDWYQDLAQAVLGKRLPVLLLQAGVTADPQQSTKQARQSNLAHQELIWRLLKGENVYDPENPHRLMRALPSNVQVCAFYLLSASDSLSKGFAWFTEEGGAQAPAQALLALRQKSAPSDAKQSEPSASKDSDSYVFDHGRYVLIAQSLQPRMQEILHKMHPYINRYKPMVGFSCEEAKKSAYILVIAYQEDFPQHEIEQLQSSGSLVKVIHPDELSASFAAVN
ncbi:MAG: hypothetical protein PWQ55_1817 [Chloroflexota bacterium]|nr:hypothetical protein [Chloroflexota bacterium]